MKDRMTEKQSADNPHLLFTSADGNCTTTGITQPISALFDMFKQILSHVMNLASTKNANRDNDRLADELHALVHVISQKLQQHVVANEAQTLPAMQVEFESVKVKVEQEYENRLNGAELKLRSLHKNTEAAQSERIAQLSEQIVQMKKMMVNVAHKNENQFIHQHQQKDIRKQRDFEVELEIQHEKVRQLERAQDSAIESQIQTQTMVDELKYEIRIKKEEISELTKALNKTSGLFAELKNELEKEKMMKQEIESKLNNQTLQIEERNVQLKVLKTKVKTLEEKYDKQRQEEEKSKYEALTLKRDMEIVRSNSKSEKTQLSRQLRNTKKRLMWVEDTRNTEIEMLTTKLNNANNVLMKLRQETLQDLADCQQKRSRFQDYVDSHRKMTVRKTLEAWVPETMTPFNKLNKLTQHLGELERLSGTINRTIQNPVLTSSRSYSCTEL